MTTNDPLKIFPTGNISPGGDAFDDYKKFTEFSKTQTIGPTTVTGVSSTAESFKQLKFTKEEIPKEITEAINANDPMMDIASNEKLDVLGEDASSDVLDILASGTEDLSKGVKSLNKMCNLSQLSAVLGTSDTAALASALAAIEKLPDYFQNIQKVKAGLQGAGPAVTGAINKAAHSTLGTGMQGGVNASGTPMTKEQLKTLAKVVAKSLGNKTDLYDINRNVKMLNTAVETLNVIVRGSADAKSMGTSSKVGAPAGPSAMIDFTALDIAAPACKIIPSLRSINKSLSDLDNLLNNINDALFGDILLDMQNAFLSESFRNTFNDLFRAIKLNNDNSIIRPTGPRDINGLRDNLATLRQSTTSNRNSNTPFSTDDFLANNSDRMKAADGFRTGYGYVNDYLDKKDGNNKNTNTNTNTNTGNNNTNTNTNTGLGSNSNNGSDGALDNDNPTPGKVGMTINETFDATGKLNKTAIEKYITERNNAPLFKPSKVDEANSALNDGKVIVGIEQGVYGGTREYNNDGNEVYLYRQNLNDKIRSHGSNEQSSLNSVLDGQAIVIRLDDSEDMRKQLFTTLADYFKPAEDPSLSNNEQLFEKLVDELAQKTVLSNAHIISETFDSFKEDTAGRLVFTYEGVNILDQIKSYTPPEDLKVADVPLSKISIDDSQSITNFCNQNGMEALLTDGRIDFNKLRSVDPQFIDFKKASNIAKGIIGLSKKIFEADNKIVKTNNGDKFKKALDIIEERVIKAAKIKSVMNNKEI